MVFLCIFSAVFRVFQIFCEDWCLLTLVNMITSLTTKSYDKGVALVVAIKTKNHKHSEEASALHMMNIQGLDFIRKFNVLKSCNEVHLC